jgi:glycosyltransferase involved in cell wall biosynthesis
MARLLILSPAPFRGGAEEYALTIGRAALGRGWEVHAAFPRTPGMVSLVRDYEQSRIAYHRLEVLDPVIHWVRPIRERFLQFTRTAQLLLRLRPDVVQVVLPWPSRYLGGILACAFLRIPTAVVFQLAPSRMGFSKWALQAYRWARRWATQEWVAVSENNRGLLAESFAMPREAFKVIYNGAAVEGTDNCSDAASVRRSREELRHELGLPPESRLITTVARLVPSKGYQDLLEVLPALAGEFDDIRFLWVGGGPRAEALSEAAREKGVRDRILFLGYRPDVPRLLRASDLFAFPTHSEGQPFALIEAMAHGLPVVTSDANGIPEVVQPNVHGLLFPAGDRARLLESLRFALRNPELMGQMARAARERSAGFTREKMCAETLALLDSLHATAASR